MAKKEDKETAMTTKKEEPIDLSRFVGKDGELTGFEHQDSTDRVLPFVVLCQPNTPMVVDGKYDLRPGDFFNTVTEQVWKKDEGLLFVPATTRHYYARWVPRDESGGGGGGFRGHLSIDDPIVARAIRESRQFGKYVVNDDRDGKLELRETYYVYGVICTENGFVDSMAVMAFWSTKIRAYKNWQTRLGMVGVKNVPIFANLTRITSEIKKNDQGAFYVPKIIPADSRGVMYSLLPHLDERREMAKALAEMIEKDRAKVDYSKQSAGGDEDDNIPF